MSRIQNILNKAERDGTVRRMRSMTDPTASRAVATVDTAPPPTAAPPPSVIPAMAVPPPVPVAPPPLPMGPVPAASVDDLGAPAASAVPELPQAHIVCTAR